MSVSVLYTIVYCEYLSSNIWNP